MHLGPSPLERLTRSDTKRDLTRLATTQPLSFDEPNLESLKHAMALYTGMFDLVREGTVNALSGELSTDLQERAEHLKAAGY